MKDHFKVNTYYNSMTILIAVACNMSHILLLVHPPQLSTSLFIWYIPYIIYDTSPYLDNEPIGRVVGGGGRGTVAGTGVGRVWTAR